MMDVIFEEEKGKFLQVYLDDIIIFSKTHEEHEKHLALVLEKIKNAGLKLKRKKCNFFKNELEILGYRVSKNMIRPTKDRIQDVHNFPAPTTIKELRSFMGLMSYCRDFIKDLAAAAKPLSDLLKGSPSPNQKLELNETQRNAFNRLKELLNDESKLTIPDFEKQFIVTTDASTHGLSGILAQRTSKGDEPISFFSKKLNDAQSKYSATQLELLAVIETLNHFKPYLMYKKFTLRTDHKALLALRNTKSPDSMLFRWSLFLSEFDYDIEYIKGETNPADVLSRMDQKTVCSISNTKKTIIIDPETQNRLISEYHLELGHGSPGNMIYNLSKKYEWKGMYTQAHRFANNCETCLMAGKQVANTNYHMVRTSAPGEMIVIDTVGPLPCSENGNKFIVTAIDHYSKLAFCRAIPHKSAECVSRFIVEEVVPKFTKVNSFLSDNGLEFKSAVTQRAANSRQIVWKFGSPYHPETQGAIERFNDTMMRKLRKLSNYSPEVWDRYVRQTEYAYNRSFHRALGCSPFEFFYKQHSIFKADQGLLSQNFKVEIPEKALETLKENITRRYDKEFEGNATARSDFKEGERVLKYNFSPQISKIAPHWDTGYTIKKIKAGSEAFTVEKDGILYEANKAHLKRAPLPSPSTEGGNAGGSASYPNNS
jgi:hypothetical protein